MEVETGRFVRLFLLSSAMVLVILLTTGYFAVERQKELLRTERLNAARIVLHHLAGIAVNPLVLGEDALHLNTLVRDAKRMEGVVYAFVVDREGKVRAHSDPARIGIVLAEFSGNENRGTQVAQGVSVLSMPVVLMEKRVGTASLGVSLEYLKKETDRAVTSLLQDFVFLGLLLLLCCMGGSLLASLRRLGPMFATADSKTHRPRGSGEGAGSPAYWDIPDPHRNQVTVVFVGVKGFKQYAESKSPEQVLKDLDRFFGIATECITAYGGYVDKFVGDAIIGVFGTSPLHEGHTIRAMKAAVAMQRLMVAAQGEGKQLLDLVGIGISSGVILSGMVGSDSDRECISIGESFKVAYSLNVMAQPGEIVISKDVYQLIEDLVSVEPLPPLETIERTEAWESFRVTGVCGRSVVHGPEAGAGAGR